MAAPFFIGKYCSTKGALCQPDERGGSVQKGADEKGEGKRGEGGEKREKCGRRTEKEGGKRARVRRGSEGVKAER